MGLTISFHPDGVLFCPEHHPQPLFFAQQSLTPFWDMYIHRTSPTPPQKTPFPGLNLKVSKWTTWTQSEQNVWKVDRTCLEVGRKHLFINKLSRTIGMSGLAHRKSRRRLSKRMLGMKPSRDGTGGQFEYGPRCRHSKYSKTNCLDPLAFQDLHKEK